MKGARIMEFDKLREVIGDYQQLDFAKGAIELPLYCAEALDGDGLGKEYWQTVPAESSRLLDGQGRSNNAPDDPRRPAWERRARCYDLVLDSLETLENKASSGGDAAERVRAHAYELAFASTDEIFHSRLYEWLISRGLADELLEVRKSHFYQSLTRRLHRYTDASTIPASLSSMRAENAKQVSASLAVLYQRWSTPPRRRSTCHLSRIVRVRTVDVLCCHFSLLSPSKILVILIPTDRVLDARRR
jgi:Non-repetitive/WGA-negative nucleoporin C-terminal